MTPTPQQEAIFDAVLNGTRNIIVNAVAGSGKTTTIKLLANLIPKTKLSVFLAFNKRIAETLVKELPYWCPARTFHSQCYSALKLGLPKVPILDTDKVRKIFKTVAYDKDEFYLYAPFVSKLVGLAKGQVTTDPAWQDLIDYHDILCDGEERVGIEYAKETFKRSNADHEHIDFDDMLYLTWLLNIRFTQVDYLFVDEAQDLNTIQHALLPRMLKSTGKIIAVGDPWQSIYAFRGADSDSMSKLQAQFDMLELPLSVCWRCSKQVVRSAQIVITEWLERGNILNKTKMDITITKAEYEADFCTICGEAIDDCICRETLSISEPQPLT